MPPIKANGPLTNSMDKEPIPLQEVMSIRVVLLRGRDPALERNGLVMEIITKALITIISLKAQVSSF